MLRRLPTVVPPLARGSFKKAADKAPKLKKQVGGGSDAYGALKRAILAEPDPERDGEGRESEEEAMRRSKQQSRMLTHEDQRSAMAV